MAINTKKYIEQFLQIRTKSAEVVPLRLNAPQQKLYAALAAQARAGKPLRAIVLKARQMGFSTLTEAMIFKRTATRKKRAQRHCGARRGCNKQPVPHDKAVL